MAAQIQEDNVSSPSILSKKGGYVAVQVDPSAYKSRLEVCKFSLIGRVVLSSGEKPWKVADLKAKMQSIWKLNSVWRLISLGKGYFQILLNSDADKNMVWILGSLNLKPGVLRLQPWMPDFNPTLHKSSNAQVWVRFYDLSWEYWHPKIISDLARGIGVPLRLDRATVEGDFGHFTRVLVDIDVSTVPPSSLLLERDDSHSSFISVEYENLPAFCSTCSSIGHFPNVCRWNKSDKGIPVSYSKPNLARDGPATVVAVEGFQVPHKHAPKLVFPQAEVSISNVFAAIQQDLGSLDSVVVHSSAGLDPILGMVSYASLVDSSCLTSLVAPTTSMVAAQVCQSQLVGRSEDSLISVPVHSSRVGVVPVSSEGPSSILDVSAGAVVSISSATSMVGQGSKVNRDSVSPLVSFAQPIVSSVVLVDELDDRVGIVSPSVERVERVVLRNGFGSSCSPILDVDSDVQVQGPEHPLSDSHSELRPIDDSSWADQVEEEELNDTPTITRRSTRIARRLASYKSGSRAFSRVSDD
ncbi:hypothetical protein LWI29_021929 [Acer saccharum]|uniref:DUF4283 domain-containing protein n=1 Tax=Acer saccharum TaxID=4024 RepID=A0AA39TFX2_ACESA|nr:hypothetical protein LWI29_021929 [Acer saccharum]